MLQSENQSRPGQERLRLFSRIGSRRGRVLTCLAAATLLGVAQPGQQPVQRDPAWSACSQSTSRVPDANDQVQMHDERTRQQGIESANAERRKHISEESAKLLKLATDLKSEVDKTNKDTLSINVIRKAGEIEKLAHSVKEEMKLAVGPG